MDKKFRIFNLYLLQPLKSLKKTAVIVMLAVGLSLGGAVSARADSIEQILQKILAISNTLSQGLQSFAGLQNVPLGGLDLPTTQETQQAIANVFGQGNPQANANNLVNNITSLNAAGIANKKIWSKEGQEEQKKITEEGNTLDEGSLNASILNEQEANAANGKDSSQEILKSISKQLKYQAIISDHQSRLLVIQNTLMQESNLQTSAANGSTASTQEMIAGQAKKKNIEEQDQLIGELGGIEMYLRD